MIVVAGKSIANKEYHKIRVVTFRDIDELHGRPDGTARKRFNDNKQYFIEGEDYFKISPSEFRTAIGKMDERQQNDVTLITESGYLMIVKSFKDNLAWTVQRELVNSYFRKKELLQQLDSYMIDDPIKRAERWIEEQKEKKALEQKIEEDKPKVEFAEQVHDSTNLSSIEDFAKALHDEDIHIGRNKLYKWLRENKYLMHNNVPYQQFIDRGLFAVTEGTYVAKGEVRTAYTTRITGKGQLYITAKLRQHWKT